MKFASSTKPFMALSSIVAENDAHDDSLLDIFFAISFSGSHSLRVVGAFDIAHRVVDDVQPSRRGETHIRQLSTRVYARFGDWRRRRFFAFDWRFHLGFSSQQRAQPQRTRGQITPFAESVVVRDLHVAVLFHSFGSLGFLREFFHGADSSLRRRVCTAMDDHQFLF